MGIAEGYPRVPLRSIRGVASYELAARNGRISFAISQAARRFIVRPPALAVMSGKFFESSARESNALLTDSSVGKIRATSGERRTRFVPFVMRARYFPRTPLPCRVAREKVLSSGSMSVVYFIDFPFLARHTARTDDSDSTGRFYMRNHQDSVPARGAESQETSLSG